MSDRGPQADGSGAEPAGSRQKKGWKEGRRDRVTGRMAGSCFRSCPGATQTSVVSVRNAATPRRDIRMKAVQGSARGRGGSKVKHNHTRTHPC